VRRQDQSDLWKEVQFLVFDAPSAPGGFECGWLFCRTALAKAGAKFTRAHAQVRCKHIAALRAELARVEALGGEGLIAAPAGLALCGWSVHHVA